MYDFTFTCTSKKKFPQNIVHAKYNTNIILVYHIMAVTKCFNDTSKQNKSSP